MCNSAKIKKYVLDCFSWKHVVVVNAVVLTICVIFAIFLPQIGTIIRLVYVTVFFTLRVIKICDRTSRLRVRLNRSESNQTGSNENPNIIQECIPVGCVPTTCCPYLPACMRWGGGVWSGVSGLGGGGGVSQHAMGQTPRPSPRGENS